MSVPLELPVGHDDHILGDPGAPVTLVEYGDFECPYCAQAYPEVKALVERFGRSLRFVFRHAPQTRFHPNVALAAEAAESAGAQGRFWEMHDALFERRSALTLDSLVEVGRGLGLDGERLRADLEAHRHREAVSRLERSGARSVRGTPTFFLDGVRYENSSDRETLGAAIEAALRRDVRHQT